MSRYPPPLRDRSPPRPFDRRNSSGYQGLVSQSYRPSNDLIPIPPDRRPPTGPRAESFRGGFGTSQRGRGGSLLPRNSESWDRDRDRDRDRERDRERERENDSRAPTNFRREDDRSEWVRRERDGGTADRAPAFRDRRPTGRERSASPPRGRRNSRENLSVLFNRQSEIGQPFFPRGRGLFRGRGRGDWYTDRGRQSFTSDRERELFPNRSRSRDATRDRDFERGRYQSNAESERSDRFDRREPEREPRAKDYDGWSRDVSPGRSSPGNRGASPGEMSSTSLERTHRPDNDVMRRPPPISAVNLTRDIRRDTELDYGPTTSELPRRGSASTAALATVPRPSQSLGLDYGPPPTAAPTNLTTINDPTTVHNVHDSEHVVTSKVHPETKLDHADADTNTQKAAVVTESAEQHVHDDQIVQSGRPTSAHNLEGPVQSDVRKDTKDPHDENDRATARNMSIERGLPPNVPSGPRAASGPVYQMKTSPVARSSQLLPQISQTRSVYNEQRPVPNAPTGPRISNTVPPSGPRINTQNMQNSSAVNTASSTWWKDLSAHQRPSIMGNLQRNRRSPNPPPLFNQTNKAETQRVQIVPPKPGDHIRPGHSSPTMSIMPPSIRKEQSKSENEEGDVSASGSEQSETDTRSEEDDILDQADYEEGEARHERELRQLQSQLPIPLLEDPTVVSLLMKIQFLGLIADGLLHELDSVKLSEFHHLINTGSNDMPKLQSRPPSPQVTPQISPATDSKQTRPLGRPLRQTRINPVLTPPTESLPHLESYSGQKKIFAEAGEDEVEQENITTMLRQQFEHMSWEERDDEDFLKKFYMEKYVEWKYEQDTLERVRREVYEPSPDPGSPGAQSAISIPPSAERLTGRTARLATEYELEKAIILSEQSAREEAERREREAASNALPNYETEAIVPDMLKPSEREQYWQYQDRNRLVPTHLAVELMEYLPPQDDFTEQEQAVFIEAYCQTPKKWGLIAERLASTGRTYQECIAHYYLTKNVAQYKEHWRRSQPKKKRGRTAAKPRSTVLLSEITVQDDTDGGPLQMTDSGRPRRAAAPTFGDNPEVDTAVIQPPAKRLAAGGKDTAESGATPKPKGRKAASGAPKTKRSKAQIASDISNALSMQVLTPETLAVPRPSMKNGNKKPSTSQRVVNSKQAMSLGTPDDSRAGLLDAHDTALMNLAHNGKSSRGEISGYWSNPELQRVRALIDCYGTDFAKVASELKSKSLNMIKNHYTREVQKGDKGMEARALLADARRSRGEVVNLVPSPNPPQKRKHDASPVGPIVHPEISVKNDISLLSSEMNMPSSMKLIGENDLPTDLLARESLGSLLARSNARPDPSQQNPSSALFQLKDENTLRSRPVVTTRQPQGPARGIFTDDMTGFAYSSLPRQSLHPYDDAQTRSSKNAITTLREPLEPMSQDANSTTSLRTREPALQSQSLLAPNPYALDAVERQVASTQRHLYNRGADVLGFSQTHPSIDHQHATLGVLNRLEGSRRIEHMDANGLGVTRSPQQHAMLATSGNRTNLLAGLTGQQFQPSTNEPVKPTISSAPKRSGIFGLLNDDVPESTTKRSSTDSTRRLTVHTPSPQNAVLQFAGASNHSADPREDFMHPRANSAFISQGQSLNHNSPSDHRGVHIGSPAPTQRKEEWMDRFAPGRELDRANSPYSVVPPSTLSSTMSSAQAVHHNSRARELHKPSHLGRVQPPSPPRQLGPSFSSIPPSRGVNQHSRVSSSLSQTPFGPDARLQPQIQTPQNHHPQQISQQQEQRMQNTAGPSGHLMVDSGQLGENRSNFQERQEHDTLAAQMQLQHEAEVRHRQRQRDDLQRQEEHHRRQQEMYHVQDDPREIQRQEMYHVQDDPREIQRQEIQHRIVPPPVSVQQQPQPIASNYGFGGPPQGRHTPPMPSFANEHGRQSLQPQNRHSHHHHHSLLGREPLREFQSQPQREQFDPRDPRQHPSYPQQQSMTPMTSMQQPQPRTGLATHEHRGMTDVKNDLQMGTVAQQQQIQSRFPASSSLSNLQTNYRGYGQGAAGSRLEERR